MAEYMRSHGMTLYLPSSTYRMGTDSDAVVGRATLKFNGIEGLYVADASAIPEMVSDNLNTTVVTIAERGARAILTGLVLCGPPVDPECRNRRHEKKRRADSPACTETKCV
ncbi:GMC oxidoreductase [Antarcticimicrobium sediminis]|uniref:GMC oxidoreductase n=1 Tax=Antarcticimicrobium sediminis TaxID=2546227 RepID=UPI001FE1F55F|nr:GMC oxidoreductase [Antarcticimicrobium sediminis]